MCFVFYEVRGGLGWPRTPSPFDDYDLFSSYINWDQYVFSVLQKHPFCTYPAFCKDGFLARVAALGLGRILECSTPAPPQQVSACPAGGGGEDAGAGEEEDAGVGGRAVWREQVSLSGSGVTLS